tara:strand:- start:43 stop:711 length:669 start_codon:yes stop_codon:yes gene_type:complete
MALNINGTTGISGVDGSVSAPAVTGTDSNTGITFPSADTIKFSTGGVERMAITNSGITGDGSALTGITSGITEFDQWYLSGTKGNGDITSNLARFDGTGAASQIGTGMSQSSGIFSFPNTGKWLVIAKVQFELHNTDVAVLTTKVTTNNSSYVNHGICSCSVSSSGIYANSTSSYSFIDVTDTSNVKVKFTASSVDGSSYLLGQAASNGIYTQFIFVRIGDT